MQVAGDQLRKILEQQEQDVMVYDSRSFSRGSVRPTVALKLIGAASYVGIGNGRRIRALRPLNGNMTIEQLHQASRLIRRPRNERGVLFAPDWVVEHRK